MPTAASRTCATNWRKLACMRPRSAISPSVAGAPWSAAPSVKSPSATRRKAQRQQGLHIGLEGGATGAGQRGGVRLGKGGLGGIKVGVRGAVGRVEQDVAQRLAALQALGIHLGQAGDHRLLGQFRKSRILAR